MGRVQDWYYQGKNVQEGRYYLSMGMGSLYGLGSLWLEGFFLVLEIWIDQCSSGYYNSCWMVELSFFCYRIFFVDNLCSF